MKNIKDIPTEIFIHHTIKNLSAQDIITLCKVDTDFNHICKDNQVWQILLKRDFPEYIIGLGGKKIPGTYIQGQENPMKVYFFLEQFKDRLTFELTSNGKKYIDDILNSDSPSIDQIIPAGILISLHNKTIDSAQNMIAQNHKLSRLNISVKKYIKEFLLKKYIQIKQIENISEFLNR